MALIEADPISDFAERAKGVEAHLSLPDGVVLKTASSAFADVSVRDAIMVEALKDQKFAFVLTTKISNYASERIDEGFDQADIEALTTATQVLTMWEQFDVAGQFLSALNNAIEHFDLIRPMLLTMTENMYHGRGVFPFAETRQSMIGLSDIMQERLDA
jgi:hypothetical protein